MARFSDIGGANTRLPAIDIINTMELQGSGTSDMGGRQVKTDFHVALGYNPVAARVELTRTPDGGAAQHTIETVRETYAWNESEIGAGLVPGKGVATPAMTAVRERLLHIWMLPYGVVKAAYAAGDKTVVSTEAGATTISAPLTGPLAGITVKATLDANSLMTKVEARADNPALANLNWEADYSNYADHAEVLSRRQDAWACRPQAGWPHRCRPDGENVGDQQSVSRVPDSAECQDRARHDIALTPGWWSVVSGSHDHQPPEVDPFSWTPKRAQNAPRSSRWVDDVEHGIAPNSKSKRFVTSVRQTNRSARLRKIWG
jgi:hypothetical protein